MDERRAAIDLELNSDTLTEANPRHFSGAATTAARAGQHAVAADLLAVSIEHALRLEAGAWNATLRGLQHASAEDLIWITDESMDAPALLKAQAKNYLDSHQRTLADWILAVLGKLDPSDHELHATRASFLFGTSTGRCVLQRHAMLGCLRTADFPLAIYSPFFIKMLYTLPFL